MAVLVLFFSLPPRFFSVLFSIFPFSIFSTLLFFNFRLFSVCYGTIALSRYNRSVPVRGKPLIAQIHARNAGLARVTGWTCLSTFWNAVRPFLDVSSVIGRAERERERERERESCVYTATINYTIMLDAGLFWGI